MEVISSAGLLKSMFPITRFNRGEAGKIFEEVRESGFGVVVKNNMPVCVLLSPERYQSLIELVSDSLLLEEAERRMASYSESENVSHEEMLKKLGISENDLADVKVEIEE